MGGIGLIRAVQPLRQQDTHRGYQPLCTPPSSEVESLLFSIQSGLGAFVIGISSGFTGANGIVQNLHNSPF